MPEHETVTIEVNGRRLVVRRGTVVAAALATAGITSNRRSVTGEARGPLCGIGICYECRVTIDGEPHHLGCQTPCEDGMRVTTG